MEATAVLPKDAIGQQVEIAMPFATIEPATLDAVFDVKAYGAALQVIHAGVHGKDDAGGLWPEALG